VEAASRDFFLEVRRRTYVTPNSYIQALLLFREIMLKRTEQAKQRLAHL
jgi:hypothetical protein